MSTREPLGRTSITEGARESPRARESYRERTRVTGRARELPRALESYRQRTRVAESAREIQAKFNESNSFSFNSQQISLCVFPGLVGLELSPFSPPILHARAGRGLHHSRSRIGFTRISLKKNKTSRAQSVD